MRNLENIFDGTHDDSADDIFRHRGPPGRRFYDRRAAELAAPAGATPQGAALFRLLQEQCRNNKAFATHMGFKSAKHINGWLVSGVPHRHVATAAGVLGCAPELIARKNEPPGSAHGPRRVSGDRVSAEGDRFYSLFHERGLNTKGIATHCGVSESSVGVWTFRGVPRRHSPAVAALLQCEPHEIENRSAKIPARHPN